MLRCLNRLQTFDNDPIDRVGIGAIDNDPIDRIGIGTIDNDPIDRIGIGSSANDSGVTDSVGIDSGCL